jgi:beta-glucosidase/6-phospho-beta-glucosidase/beta-galactosidase
MRGRYDMAAVQRYHDILDSLLRRGLTPNVTLR